MRLALAAVLSCACTLTFDPVEDIPHREFATTGDAVRAILADAGRPRVYAVGEYHATRAVIVRRSPLAHFTGEIIGLLEPHAQHLVVEAWLDGTCRGDEVDPIATQVTAATGRAPTTRDDLQHLISTSRHLRMQTHGLPVTCIEHSSVLDARGRVDFYRLLLLVTEKLGSTARRLAHAGRAVIVYGGALHNDLYPRWLLEDLSYARSLAADLGGGVLEIDLVVPEIVAPMALVRLEPWFPLLGRASPDRVIVWSRGPDSYVVILPAETEAVAKVAKPRAVM